MIYYLLIPILEDEICNSDLKLLNVHLFILCDKRWKQNPFFPFCWLIYVISTQIFHTETVSVWRTNTFNEKSHLLVYSDPKGERFTCFWRCKNSSNTRCLTSLVFYFRISWSRGGLALWRWTCRRIFHSPNRVWWWWMLHPDSFKSWSRGCKCLHLQGNQWPRGDIVHR